MSYFGWEGHYFGWVGVSGSVWALFWEGEDEWGIILGGWEWVKNFFG